MKDEKYRPPSKRQLDKLRELGRHDLPSTCHEATQWINKLIVEKEKLPCPDCSSVEQVRLQTPAESDGMVRRCYWRCFKCGHVSGTYPGWEAVHWRESGKISYAPLLKFWNEWVEKERAAKGEK